MKRLQILLLALAIAGWSLACRAQTAVSNSEPAASAEKAKKSVNYDESKVPQYGLEDPLSFANGKRLISPDQWPARRAEILGIFAREMYGQPPPDPETVEFELVEEGPTLSGLGIRRQYRMWFRRDRTGPFLDWLVLLPNEIRGGKPSIGKDGRIVSEMAGRVPVVLMLNYRGNHEFLTDPQVSLPEGAWIRTETGSGASWDRAAAEKRRGVLRDTGSASQFPAETILARGYAFMTACYGQVSPDVELKKGDTEDLAYTGVFELWPKRDPARDDNTTALGAWAWALSRGLDLAEKIPEIDAKKSVVTGCSRLGKAALLAAARDERFSVCVPNQTGGGGAPLSKRVFGENVATEMVEFPHWYCRAYAKYAGNERAMPFDQHLLLAAVAPRGLLVEGYNSNWFDPKGEYLACQAASPAWEFLGAGRLPGEKFPDEYSTAAIGPRLGYVRRGGRHGMSGHDWKWALDFADGVWTSKPSLTPCAGDIDFQKLIDDAALAGGGVVTVPPGRHLTKGLILKSNVELHLEKGATLEGSSNVIDYVKAMIPYSEGDWMAVVMAIGADNVAITGEGEIFGNGTAWPLPQNYGGNQEGLRPRGLAFLGCRNIRLEDFTLRDAACWGIVLKCCDGVVARRVKISSQANANNDGFDVEARNVVIEDCDVESGDDSYCLKSNDPGFPVENIVVRRCVGRTFCNQFKLGTASHGKMRNVLFENCRGELPKRWFMDTRFGRNRKMYAYEERSARNFLLRDRENGAGISSIAVECVDGGIVEHVVFRDIEIDGVGVPIFVRGGMRTGRSCGTPPNDKYVIRDILIENVRGRWSSATANSISGVEGCRVSNVMLKNVHLHGPGAGDCEAEKTRPVPERPGSYPEANLFRCMLPAYGLWARHVDDLALDNVTFTLDEGTSDSRDAVVTDDVTGFHDMDPMQ